MMTTFRAGALETALALLASMPARADAQPARWLADVTASDTVFVDEDVDHFLTLGGTARMQVSPRIAPRPRLSQGSRWPLRSRPRPNYFDIKLSRNRIGSLRPEVRVRVADQVAGTHVAR
jgi:hypothetical protein